MNLKRLIQLSLLSVPALLLAAGCSSADSSDPQSNQVAVPPQALSRVALLGDSVAAQEASPLTEALAASGVEFVSLASDGGGSVVGPVAPEVWKKLPQQLAESGATTIIYQITSYDWGTAAQQSKGYQRLVQAAADHDAHLVFVTMPPIQPDDFYEPHMAELASAAAAARTTAEESDGRADFLDASEVWGDTYQRERNGTVDRSSDGVHTCPQGAARFTSWLMTGLADLNDGFTPADADSWANSGWAADDHFVGC